MKVSEPESGGYRAPEPGTYLARCVKLIDLGTQTTEYQGQPLVRHQVLVGWELPTELIPDGDSEGLPYAIAKFYTMSLQEKANLRHDLVNWRGKEFTQEELKGFDLKNILGIPCLLTVTHNDNGKARVTAVTAPPKGTIVPDQVNPNVYLSLEPDEFDGDVYDSLSDGIRNMIEDSPEYDKLMGGNNPELEEFRNVDFGGEQIPF